MSAYLRPEVIKLNRAIRDVNITGGTWNVSVIMSGHDAGGFIISRLDLHRDDGEKEELMR